MKKKINKTVAVANRTRIDLAEARTEQAESRTEQAKTPKADLLLMVVAPVQQLIAASAPK